MAMLVTAKWSLEDYHQIVESGILDQRHVELINGEIVEMASDGEPHAYSSDEAGEYLMVLLGDRTKVRHAKPTTLPTREKVSDRQPKLRQQGRYQSILCRKCPHDLELIVFTTIDI